MARKPRLVVAGMPHHVVQRGNNKDRIFFSSADYKFFLDVLLEAKTRYPCRIYSYCLMINHFHLLISPEKNENISLLMKLLGAKYVRYINKAYGRTGTLWEGRFKCSLVQEELYFLSCLRYIEMNPLRAGMVNSPEMYRWSSFRFRGFGEKSPFLDLDPWYNSLAEQAQERQFAYRKFFQDSASEKASESIRGMIRKGSVVGNREFEQEIETITGRKVHVRPPGRPWKSEK
jgi:putative transposase